MNSGHGAAAGKGKQARGPATMAPELPKDAGGGWALKGRVAAYDKKTLFDRINGAAPAYIRAGYVGSLGAEYGRAGLEEPVVVDVYDMGTPVQALGMYATERDTSYTFVEVGAEGYLASGSLNFWHQRYYIKIAGFEEGEAVDAALQLLGKGLAKALTAKDAKTGADVLAPLAKLPTKGRVPHSAGYSHPPLADIDGLSKAYYVDFKEENDPVRLFVVPVKSGDSGTKRLAAVQAYFEKDGAKATQADDGGLTLLRIAGEDTFAAVLLVDGALCGAVDMTEPAVADRVATSLVEHFKKTAGKAAP